jgi:16S rRNA processing protein RimM
MARAMTSKSSTTEPSDAEDVLVGLIHKPHGLRGEVAVEVLSDVPGRFAVGADLMLTVPGVPRRAVRVRSVRPQGRGMLVAFEGVATRDAAETLREGRLEIERARVPPREGDEFYHFELAGCRCYDRGRDLGEVTGVLEDGGGALLAVVDGEVSLLIPFVKEFLAEVDIARRRIDLELPEGLVDACTSRS